MPELVELHEEWNGRGVRVVAVCLDAEDRTPAELLAFANEHSIDLPVQALAGSWDPISDHYGFMGPPCTVLIGPGGEILERWDGRLERAEVERRLAALP